MSELEKLFPGLSADGAKQLDDAETKDELFAALYSIVSEWDNFRYGQDMDKETFTKFMNFIYKLATFM